MKQAPIFNFFSKKRQRKVVLNQGGQALVEYVLMLVVIVSLILSLRGVFTSMNSFMSDFMGEYIVCLMEYGELPSLGVSNSDLKQHDGGTGGKKCEFRKFSGAVVFGGGGGGGPGGPGSGGGSGGGPGGGSGKNSSSAGGKNGQSGSSSKNGASNKDSGDSSDNDSAGSSRGSSSSAKRSRGATPYANGQISRSGSGSTADAPQDLNNEKVKVLSDSEGSKKSDGRGADYGRNQGRNTTYSNGKYKAITGAMAEEIEKKSKMSPRKPGSTILKAEGGYRFLPAKKTISPPEKTRVIEEKKDESFSFGFFFKWLIIAGIVIMCFIVFGGGALNFSNSSDN